LGKYRESDAIQLREEEFGDADMVKQKFWDEQYLKRNVIPKVMGCTIHQSRVNTSSNYPFSDWTVTVWSVKYPGATPYEEHKRWCYDAASSLAAARHVVEWLWFQLKLAHPDVACSWDVSLLGRRPRREETDADGDAGARGPWCCVFCCTNGEFRHFIRWAGCFDDAVVCRACS